MFCLLFFFSLVKSLRYYIQFINLHVLQKQNPFCALIITLHIMQQNKTKNFKKYYTQFTHRHTKHF